MIHLRPSLSRRSRWFFIAIGLLLVAGCGERGVTTAPGTETGMLTAELASPPGVTPAASLPYPLAVGNRWQHLRKFEVFGTDSVGEWFRMYSVTADVERTILGISEADGRDYFLQREVTTERGAMGPPFVYTFGVRQDRAGLYEWDVGATLAREHGAVAATAGPSAPSRMSAIAREIERLSPEHARKLEMLEHVVLPGRWLGMRDRGGPFPGELVRLAYPLRPRARWIVRVIDESALTATVVDIGPVTLPSGTQLAWKIRYDWPGVYGPNDRVELWYGRLGYLGMRADLVSVGTDLSGNPVEIVRSVMEEDVVSADLVGR